MEPQVNVSDPRIKELIWNALVAKGMYEGSPNLSIPIQNKYPRSKIMGMSDANVSVFLTLMPELQPEVNRILGRNVSFPFTDLPSELQANIMGRISPTAREFSLVSSAYKTLADYALAQNVEQSRLVDPTIGMPDREMFFKLIGPGSESSGSLGIVTSVTQGEYFEPKPGLLGNIKALRADRGSWRFMTGLVYGTFPKSYVEVFERTVEPDDREKLEVLKSVPGTDYVKFVSLVTFNDYDTLEADYQKRLAKIEKFKAKIMADTSLTENQRKRRLAREDKRINEVKFSSTSTVLYSQFSEEVAQSLRDYRDRNSIHGRRIIIPTSSKFIGYPESAEQNLETLRKWKYPESGAVDLSSIVRQLELVISRPDREKPWSLFLRPRVFPDYNVDSVTLNINPVIISRHADDNPGWNVRMIPIPHQYVRDRGLIIPSLQDDVYVV